jgi:hypothetical protein
MNWIIDGFFVFYINSLAQKRIKAKFKLYLPKFLD